MEQISYISIICGGILSLIMGIFHTQFFKLFKWKKEFEKLTAANKNILYTVHLALLLLFFLFGIISLAYAKELSRAIGISFGINLLYSLFWLWRAVWQIVYFKPDKNSKLKSFHYGLTFYFILLFTAYIIPVILKVLR